MKKHTILGTDEFKVRQSAYANRNAEFQYNHFTLTITEKVTMDKPDAGQLGLIEFLDATEEYEKHVATRRSFHYELTEADHGKSKFEGIDFEVRFQQCTEIKGRGKVWEDCTDALYSMSHVGMRRIVAVPIVPVVKQDERKFTLEEALKIWDAGEQYQYRMTRHLLKNEKIVVPNKKKYFKQTFGININAKREEGTEATQPH